MSYREDSARIYQLHREIATVQQGELLFEEGSGLFDAAMDELDYYQPLVSTVAEIRKQTEQSS